MGVAIFLKLEKVRGAAHFPFLRGGVCNYILPNIRSKHCNFEIIHWWYKNVLYCCLLCARGGSCRLYLFNSCLFKSINKWYQFLWLPLIFVLYVDRVKLGAYYTGVTYYNWSNDQTKFCFYCLIVLDLVFWNMWLKILDLNISNYKLKILLTIFSGGIYSKHRSASHIFCYIFNITRNTLIVCTCD